MNNIDMNQAEISRIEVNKVLVAQRFARAHPSYAEHATIQHQVASQLMALITKYLPHTSVDQVLEIGCGSGSLSYLFAEHYDYKTYFLNDLTDAVMHHYQNLEQIQWCIGDIEQITLPHSLDLIMSSSTLQWVHDIDQILSKAKNALKVKGLFCFSTFGKQNLKEIKALTERGLHYYSMEEIRVKLLGQGFEILHLSEDYNALKFDHPKQVLQHLKATGVTATSLGQFRWTKRSLESFYMGYRRFIATDEQENLIYPLSYHPIYVVVRRAV